MGAMPCSLKLTGAKLVTQKNQPVKASEFVWIDDSCINCDMCVPECPSDSIHMIGRYYQINEQTCIRCEHYYQSPTCIEVCPIGSVRILPLPAG